MIDFALQFLWLAILVIGMWLGARRWLIQYRHAMTVDQATLLLLVLLTFLGGAIGALPWWFDLPISFSWDLPPLASRMLGAAGASFAVGAFMALEGPTTQRLRQIVFMLFVYLTPLVIAIFAAHLDRFDFTEPIVYSFFTVAALMTVVTLYHLIRRTPGVIDAPPDPAPLIDRIWLIVVALITGLWGIALFVTADGAADFIWVWRGDLLTSRLIGSMLLTIATGALVALSHRDTARQMRAVTLVYGLGLAFAAIWNSFAGLPVKWSYVVVFGMIGVVSGVIELVAQSRSGGDATVSEG